MNNKAISVIIPVFNVEKYLRRCIDSILLQSFTDFEIILVDDGSVDKSPEICDEYAFKDERIRVIHKKNGGVSAARNNGLEIANGEFIMFIDSDDYLLEGSLRYAYENIKELKVDVLLLGNNFRCKTKVRKILEESDIKQLKINVLSFNDSTFWKIGINIDAPWAKIFRRSVIEDNKIRFPEDIHRSEDAIFDLLVYECSRQIAIDNTVVYSYESNPTSICTYYGKKEISIIPMIIHHKKELIQKYHPLDKDYDQALAYRTLKAIIDADVRLFTKYKSGISFTEARQLLLSLLNNKIISENIDNVKYSQATTFFNKLRIFLYKHRIITLDILFFRLLHLMHK